MKTNIKKIAKKLGKFDISPFSRGGNAKLLLYVLWGLNAAFFICNDIQVEKKFNSEQLEHLVRINEEHVCINFETISEPSGSLHLFGLIFLPDFKTLELSALSILSGRAPPEFS